MKYVLVFLSVFSLVTVTNVASQDVTSPTKIRLTTSNTPATVSTTQTTLSTTQTTFSTTLATVSTTPTKLSTTQTTAGITTQTTSTSSDNQKPIQPCLSNTSNLILNLIEEFKPSLENSSSPEYANVTQRIQNFINQSMIKAQINGLISISIISLEKSGVDFIWTSVPTIKASLLLSFNRLISTNDVQAAVDNQANAESIHLKVAHSNLNESRNKMYKRVFGLTLGWFIVSIAAISICFLAICGFMVWVLKRVAS